MKGAVFIALNNMIEDQYGIETWENILAVANPASKGVFTSVEDYPDQELVALVSATCTALNAPIDTVLRTFGKFLFGELNGKYPIFTQINPHFFPFLLSINGIIHKEVRKLYANACLPEIDSEQIANDTLLMNYVSDRKLCHLAEGLIQGAAEHFNHTITFKHDVCMHKGDDHCEINVIVTGTNSAK